MMWLYYMIIVPAVWIVLTGLIFWLWYVIHKKAGEKWGYTIAAVFTLIILAWLFASVWYGGGRKFYYDAEVRRLCAIDGGVKVYETVTLPADRFDTYGNVNVYSIRSAKPTDEYYYEKENEALKTGNPSVNRITTQIIRRSDGKVLGESIRYSRGGGDLPLPSQPSAFSCPAILDLNLETSIFRKEI
jgi:hypothetical protein